MVFDGIRGLLEDPPGPPWGESKLWDQFQSNISDLSSSSAWLPVVPERLHFLVGRVLVHGCRMQDSLHVTCLSCEGTSQEGCVGSRTWRLGPSSLWKEKMQGKAGVRRSLSFLNSSWHLCLKVQCSHPFHPCLRGEQESRTERRASYPRIIGNRHAMHCVVLTRRRVRVSSQALWCSKYLPGTLT